MPDANSQKDLNNPEKTPADIFSETDESPAGVMAKAPAARSLDPGTMPLPEPSAGRLPVKNILMAIGALLVFGALGWGGYMGYNKFLKAKLVENKPPATQSPAGNEKSTDTSKETENSKTADIRPEASSSQPQILDQDRDGLSDDEERILGLNWNSVDSDNDGLFDREEVKVYKTDPKKADTDNDGFKDGDEVKKGFNPSGEGKLYEKAK